MKIIFEEIFPQYVHAYGNVISIPIIDTDELNKLADDIRVKEGKTPFFNEYPGKCMDIDAWYEMRLILDRTEFTPVEIEFWAENNIDADETVYYIPIEDKESVMCDVINEISEFDMTLAELQNIY